MREFMMSAAAIGALALVVAVGPAEATEHKGCSGVSNAMTKANGKAQPALSAVASKLGCGSSTPAPVDPVVCPAGQVSLAKWTYTGDGTPNIYDGFDWTNSVWTLTSGDAALAGPVMNANPDGNGFYWVEATTDLVASIVMKSFAGTVVTLTPEAPADDPTWVLDPSKAVSVNKFGTDRSGINVVNFCGAAA